MKLKQYDVVFDSPAKEIKEKLLSNSFQAFGVEYRPELDDCPLNAFALIRYNTSRDSSLYFNSFAMELKAIVFEKNNHIGMVRMEADIKHFVKTMFYIFVIVSLIFQIILFATCMKDDIGVSFSVLLPTLLLLFALCLLFVGRIIAISSIKKRINNICGRN